MILRWGRRGLIAGALAVAFVTPVTSPTNTLKEVQHRPSFKHEFRFVKQPSSTSIHRHHISPDFRLRVRHVTPVAGPAPSTAGIHRHQVLPDYKFNARHVTPVAAPTTNVHRYEIRPDYKFKVSYLTPVDAPPVVVDPPATTQPTGRGSGPTHGIRQEGYNKHRDDALRETRRNRILREDEEVIAVIMSMLKNGLL